MSSAAHPKGRSIFLFRASGVPRETVPHIRGLTAGLEAGERIERYVTTPNPRTAVSVAQLNIATSELASADYVGRRIGGDAYVGLDRLWADAKLVQSLQDCLGRAHGSIVTERYR